MLFIRKPAVWWSFQFVTINLPDWSGNIVPDIPDSSIFRLPNRYRSPSASYVSPFIYLTQPISDFQDRNLILLLKKYQSMASNEIPTENRQEEWKHWQKRGKIFGGLVLLGIGAFLLARELGVALPDWLLTWKVLLIVLGLFIGIKNNFRRMFWIFPVVVGSV